MDGIRIVEIPAMKMAVSGPGTWDDGVLRKFAGWLSQLPQTLTPQDFLWFDNGAGKFVWGYLLVDPALEPAGFEVVDFAGGLFAVTVCKDADEVELQRAARRLEAWIERSACFELDERPGRNSMGQVITPPAVFEAMGYRQMDLYFPIRMAAAK
ncbi:GyrI-like domain-containing protein [Victivallis sp. Marseille-Q1083]|uniref:GyrI-like domain-containing protein n=1 Tax=Victivallis sp. Marseille-Q1083 TaxID=2717288 RepID=UPI00158E58B1|nr:GyrI-like domain-containing protein [Victivallis sp. Marseille-Q1083]